MAKPELGEKHTCVSCGARFFDLGKEPAVCPKCGTEQPAEQPRLKRTAPLPEEKKAAKPMLDGDDVDVEVPDDGEDEDILADADDLDDDAGVIEADIDVQPEGNDDER